MVKLGTFIVMIRCLTSDVSPSWRQLILSTGLEVSDFLILPGHHARFGVKLGSTVGLVLLWFVASPQMFRSHSELTSIILFISLASVRFPHYSLASIFLFLRNLESFKTAGSASAALHTYVVSVPSCLSLSIAQPWLLRFILLECITYEIQLLV